MTGVLPYGRQFVDEADIAAVVAVLRSGFLTTGPAVTAFESALVKATDSTHAVACINGTAALHLAMLALGIAEGDLVIVPSMTFLASANAVRYVGAEVVFADVDPDTGLLTPSALESAVARSPKPPRAVIAVHLNGQTADLDGLAAVCKSIGAFLVEDACHALGAEHHYSIGKGVVGDTRRSHLACFSFHPVKTVTTGEGGAVTTRDPVLAERLARFRNHGMSRIPDSFTIDELAFGPNGEINPWHYEMSEIGYNFRLSDLNCALGVSQLAKLPVFLQRRRALVERYDNLIGCLSPIVQPVRRVAWCHPSWHLYAVHCDFEKAGRSRARVMSELRERGIGTQVHYIPVHRQPYYMRRYGSINLPGANSYFSRQLSLPLFFGMDDNDPARVVNALRDALGMSA
ncbi:MAG: UDP-4-amino-4,6-dideoxy-N-acetyl-beta-L-altrosamine transaminase [Pseudorhodoplanes sp.]|jgi:UDP-4-amino-4,6-dideoxy-N-acetyl-beta-L-altrosamine transaminase|nr:UDP-4-amino-4,6-dideoxy-N-acetyl-beta-L-altrosamine transaminase [Pseudorhodoplanes sp.]